MPILEEEGILREILGRTIAVETELKNVKEDVRELKNNNKEFAEKISRITLDYHQAKGAIQLANWIALAVIALTAGLGSLWWGNIHSNQQNDNSQSQRKEEIKRIPGN